ncbi:TPA: hypothetical protein MBH56_005495 [Klebsiella pneumoniae]|nr:hypothetical protein [Klebsiella pneumoniae]
MSEVINAEQLTDMLIYSRVMSVKELDDGWMIECQDMDFDIDSIAPDENGCVFIWDTPLKSYHCSSADFVTAKTNAIKDAEERMREHHTIIEKGEATQGTYETYENSREHRNIIVALGLAEFDDLWGR